VAKKRKQDVCFYLMTASLILLVLLSTWYKANQARLEVGTKRLVQTVQISLIGAAAVLFLFSFRKPLHRMNQSLFKEKQEIVREKRRKKKSKRG